MRIEIFNLIVDIVTSSCDTRNLWLSPVSSSVIGLGDILPKLPHLADLKITVQSKNQSEARMSEGDVQLLADNCLLLNRLSLANVVLRTFVLANWRHAKSFESLATIQKDKICSFEQYTARGDHHVLVLRANALHVPVGLYRRYNARMCQRAPVDDQFGIYCRVSFQF